tara:strand:- start:28 stop:198 length:171 start_codon:yes stop_codon:yes gene_type:complete
MRKAFKIGDLVSYDGQVGVVVEIKHLLRDVSSYRIKWSNGTLLWEAPQFLFLEAPA